MKCSSETIQNLLCFMCKKTPCTFCRFSFRATLVFSLMNAMVYSKFWSVSLEHFIEHKPLIYEEWTSMNLNLMCMNTKYSGAHLLLTHYVELPHIRFQNICFIFSCFFRRQAFSIYLFIFHAYFENEYLYLIDNTYFK